MLSFTLELCNSPLSIFQDFVFAYFKTKTPMSVELTFKTSLGVKSSKPTLNVRHLFECQEMMLMIALMSLKLYENIKLRFSACLALGTASTLPYNSNLRWRSYYLQPVKAADSMSLSKSNRIWLVVEAECAKPSVCHPCAIFYYNT